MKIALILLGLLGSLWFAGTRGGGERYGAPEEVHATYHGNGHRKALTPLHDGLPHGLAQEWFADGSLAAEGSYDSGLRSGPWSFFLSDGSLDAERSGEYREGRRVDDLGRP